MRPPSLACAVALLLLLPGPAATCPLAQATRRVDLGLGGAVPDAPVMVRGIAGNGRFVLLESAATNLVADDTNELTDLFVRDLLRGENERVSVDRAGAQGAGGSRNGTISADGRFVAFESGAALVADDTNGVQDVYLRDRERHLTIRVSVDEQGGQAARPSEWGSVSADGRHVAFNSPAHMTADDVDNVNDVFVRDRDPDGDGDLDGQAITVRLSRPFAGDRANGGSFFPRISGNGRRVVFHGLAWNLAPGDTNGDWDVFVRDRDPDGDGVLDESDAVTAILSVSSTGVQGRRASRDASIDHEGRHAAFWSDSGNLVPGDTNRASDVFVRDLVLRTTVRVSLDAAGREGDNASLIPALSADGRFVAFVSMATNLVAGDTNGRPDVFVHDRDPDGDALFDEGNGLIRRESLSPFDVQGAGSHTLAFLSADGRRVAFQSSLADLEPGAAPSAGAVYLRDRIRLSPLGGPERDLGFRLEGAFGQEARTVQVLLSASETQLGSVLKGAWVPLLPDRWTVLSLGRLRAVIDAGGAAVIPIPASSLGPGPLPPSLRAAALVLARDEAGAWPVTPPVALGPQQNDDL